MRNGGVGYTAIPSALHVPLFEAILVNLGDFERYNAPGSDVDGQSRFEIIWAFLFALARFDTKFFERNEAVADMVLQSWPTVIKWLWILTRDTSDDNVMIFSHSASHSQIIADLLEKLTSASKTKHIHWEEEFVAFAFQFWSRTNHDSKASSASSFILSQCMDNVEFDLPRLEEITKWNVDQIMDLVISRIRLAAAHIHEGVYSLQGSLMLLEVILRKDHEPTISSCVSLGAVGVLLNVIRSSLRHMKNMSRPTLVKHVNLASNCFHRIHNILENVMGTECTDKINMALQDGVLEMLLSMSPYSSPRLGSDIGHYESFPLMFLCEYLPRLLIFTSCIRNTVRATQKLKLTALEAVAGGDSSFRRAWHSLQRLLSYRVASATFFALNKPIYRCSNVRWSFLMIITEADTSIGAVQNDWNKKKLSEVWWL